MPLTAFARHDGVGVLVNLNLRLGKIDRCDILNGCFGRYNNVAILHSCFHAF